MKTYKTYKILLVDDDPLILQSISSALEQEEYHVTTADNGEEAIELINKNHFDLVLTDLVMDNVDGMAVLKEAKEKNPDGIVIILTGYGDLISAIEALRLDADDYLLKPCETEELTFRISSSLEKMELKLKVKAYETIVPVCCECKSIRDDTGKEIGTGEWMSVEQFILTKSKAAVSPTYCPDCIKTELERIKILKDLYNNS
jgi:YesN/AraC family two-component response regulator